VAGDDAEERGKRRRRRKKKKKKKKKKTRRRRTKGKAKKRKKKRIERMKKETKKVSGKRGRQQRVNVLGAGFDVWVKDGLVVLEESWYGEVIGREETERLEWGEKGGGWRTPAKAPGAGSRTRLSRGWCGSSSGLHCLVVAGLGSRGFG
jgi:hypothetical protein